MIVTTKKQRLALKRVFYRLECDHNLKNYRVFRKSVIMGYDFIMVPFAGMYLGIEKDGYTHS